MVGCLLMFYYMSQMALWVCHGTALTSWWKTALRVIQTLMTIPQVKVTVCHVTVIKNIMESINIFC